MIVVFEVSLKIKFEFYSFLKKILAWYKFNIKQMSSNYSLRLSFSFNATMTRLKIYLLVDALENNLVKIRFILE